MLMTIATMSKIIRKTNVSRSKQQKQLKRKWLHHGACDEHGREKGRNTKIEVLWSNAIELK